MLELRNLSFIEYASLGEDDRAEYDFALKYAKPYIEPVNEFELPKLIDCTFEIVKEKLQDNYERGILTWDIIFEVIAVLKNITIKDIVREKLIKVSRQKEWIVSELNNILKLEQQLLSFESPLEQQEAAEGLFEGMGILIQLNTLSGGKVYNYDNVRKLKYSDCLATLILENRRAKCEQRYQKIIERKYKK
jgi:hypothetical protein